ncbi:MAG: chloride channel protein [Microthrixaceae bacterium]
MSPWFALRLAVAGVVFGLASTVFIELTDRFRRLARHIRFPPLRTVLGGIATIGLALLFGRQYLGLSVPLVGEAFRGHDTSLAIPALKLLFTTVALGTAFPGGEVTPLFVIGSTLGAAMGHLLGLPVPVVAGVGFVAVFAGAANSPLACTIMAAEVFGRGVIVPAAIGCVISYVASTHRGLYETQTPFIPKWRHLEIDQ